MKIVLNYRIDLDKIPEEVAKRLQNEYQKNYDEVYRTSLVLADDLFDKTDIHCVIEKMKHIRENMIHMDEQLEDYIVMLSTYSKAKSSIELSSREILSENIIEKEENKDDQSSRVAPKE